MTTYPDRYQAAAGALVATIRAGSKWAARRVRGAVMEAEEVVEWHNWTRVAFAVVTIDGAPYTRTRIA